MKYMVTGEGYGEKVGMKTFAFHVNADTIHNAREEADAHLDLTIPGIFVVKSININEETDPAEFIMRAKIFIADCRKRIEENHRAIMEGKR
jgi:hypothetical protein